MQRQLLPPIHSRRRAERAVPARPAVSHADPVCRRWSAANAVDVATLDSTSDGRQRRIRRQRTQPERPTSGREIAPTTSTCLPRSTPRSSRPTLRKRPSPRPRGAPLCCRCRSPRMCLRRGPRRPARAPRSSSVSAAASSGCCPSGPRLRSMQPPPRPQILRNRRRLRPLRPRRPQGLRRRSWRESRSRFRGPGHWRRGRGGASASGTPRPPRRSRRRPRPTTTTTTAAAARRTRAPGRRPRRPRACGAPRPRPPRAHRSATKAVPPNAAGPPADPPALRCADRASCAPRKHRPALQRPRRRAPRGAAAPPPRAPGNRRPRPPRPRPRAPPPAPKASAARPPPPRRRAARACLSG
mmetsp:Transcript_108029/g.344963  ORF Transcript_108029/g.344963 Transcript_108029/m.344963 type:complete len:355 (+) Transcript_108029:1726-2790(+)